MDRKWLAALILTVIIGSVSVYIYTSPLGGEVEDKEIKEGFWTTENFVSGRFSISFSHPNGWALEKKRSGQNLVVTAVENSPGGKKPEAWFRITAGKLRIGPIENLKERVLSTVERSENLDLIAPPENVEFGPVSGITFTIETSGTEGGHRIRQVILPREESDYIVSAIAEENSWKEFKPELEGMLESLTIEKLSKESRIREGVDVGMMAPDFTLTSISGKKFSLSDHQGKVVVIDFMATWCGPCKTEMKHLKKVSSEYGEEVKLLSIDVDPSETEDTIEKFKQSFGAEWTFASGPKVGTTYRVSGIPTLYVIGENGRISYKNVGITPYSDLSPVLDNLLRKESSGGT